MMVYLKLYGGKKDDRGEYTEAKALIDLWHLESLPRTGDQVELTSPLPRQVFDTPSPITKQRFDVVGVIHHLDQRGMTQVAEVVVKESRFF